MVIPEPPNNETRSIRTNKLIRLLVDELKNQGEVKAADDIIFVSGVLDLEIHSQF